MLEKQFCKHFGLRKPMFKVWYYEGYYEDFSWCSRWKDATEILKNLNTSVENFKRRLKKWKEKYKKDKDVYHYFTDSIEINGIGRVSRIEWDYPEITDEIYLKLICKFNISKSKNIKELKRKVLRLAMEQLTKNEIDKIMKES